MSFRTVITYPRGEGAKVNLQYYKDKHMPLIEKIWKPVGLEGFEVVECGEDSPFIIISTLKWKSKEAAHQAMTGETAGEAFGDMANFAENCTPTPHSGNLLTSG